MLVPMFTAALAAIKKFLGFGGDVRETKKRPLEEESENEYEEVEVYHASESQPKKRCLHHSVTSSNDTPSRLSPLLMRFPWITARKEENQNSSPEMSGLNSPKQKEDDADVIVVEEKVKKWNVPLSTTTNVPVSDTFEQQECEVLEKREVSSVSEPTTNQSRLGLNQIADFRFVPTRMQHVEPESRTTHKSRDLNYSTGSRSYKPISNITKPNFKPYCGTAFDRLMGKKSPLILSSRIKHSVVQKSFLHEEKMKYRQLLQQYTHHLTPSSKTSSKTASSFSSPVGMVIRSQWTPVSTKQKQQLIENHSSLSCYSRQIESPGYSVNSSPVGMVTHSRWTPVSTKQKQQQIEHQSSVLSSSRVLPPADTSLLDEVLGSKKIIGLEASAEGSHKQRNTNESLHIPFIDISKEDKEEEIASDEESDNGSVIMVKEVLSQQSQRNSLEDRLKEYPVYDLDWVKSIRKEYEDRTHSAKKDAENTSKLIQELEQKRKEKVSLDDKVTQRLKLLDLSYPSEYTEVKIPDEEEEEPFVPLTPEMEDEIDDAMNKAPPSKVLIEKFHIQITRRDIKTLDGLNWLNDEVINFYVNLIMERSQKNDNYPSVYAFNTFFYPKLSKSGFQSIRRWTRKIDVFSYDILLVPVHLGMHWCMSVVDFKMKCITYYDSMLSSNEWCLQTLLEYLEAEHQDKKHSPYSTRDWKLVNKKDIPQQMNGSDCGMFACKFADYLSRRAKINFNQEHMPYFRRRMVYEIINAKLLS